MMVDQSLWAKPVMIAPTATLKEAADKMAETDRSMLPVGTYEGLEGIITERAIMVGAVSQGKDPKREKVSDHMTRNVFLYDEDDTACPLPPRATEQVG